MTFQVSSDGSGEEATLRTARLSAETFASRLTLETFALYGPEPELEIWFNDGNLFFGHSVSVLRTEHGAYVDAGIRG